MTPLKLAFYWGASCGGCEESIVDLHEKVVDLLSAAEILFWPCVMDFKYDDLERIPDGSIDVGFFNGAIRNEENLHMARILRRKSTILVAYGACAGMGGIPGLANLRSLETMMAETYLSSPSTVNPEGILPQPITRVLDDDRQVTLPAMRIRVDSLPHLVPIDYLMPGCPPSAHQTWKVIEQIQAGTLPEKGSIIGAGDKSVCQECPREKRNTPVRRFTRPHLIETDPTWCLLEQGLLCMGPATRSGCDACCLKANMPCTGCYGAAGDTLDQGAKMISVIGSLIASDDCEVIRKVMTPIVDPLGTFYRFGIPGSMLNTLTLP